MNVQQFRKQRRLQVQQLEELCKTHLGGYSDDMELDEGAISKLDAALQNKEPLALTGEGEADIQKMKSNPFLLVANLVHQEVQQLKDLISKEMSELPQYTTQQMYKAAGDIAAVSKEFQALNQEDLFGSLSDADRALLQLECQLLLGKENV